MKYNVLHNFISPVTGRVLSDYNYVLVGNKQGIAIPSPILIDIRLDLINLRKRYNSLVEADFVIGHANRELPEAQVLSNFPNGFVYSTNGNVSTVPNFFQLPLCYAASTGNLTAVYNNGTNGVGATLTSVLPATFGVDSVVPGINSIILVKDQIITSENGIYIVTNTGGLITSWVLTRIEVYDQIGEINPGNIVSVEFGTVNAQTLWVETSVVFIIGTDPILFIPMSLFNTLPENNIWIGNNLNKPIANPTISIGNLPNLGTASINIPNPFDPTNPIIISGGKVWRGTDSNRPEESNIATVLEADVLLLTARFLTTAWILRTPGITPRILWPNAQFLTDLAANSLLIHTTNGTIGVATLTSDNIWIGDATNVPVEKPTINVSNLPALTSTNIWIGDATNRPVEQPQIAIGNLPNLTFKAIWRGNALNKPIESNDLVILEAKVTNIEDVLIPGLEAEIAALEAEIVALEAEIAAIQAQVTGLALAVAVLQGQIVVIQGQIAALNTRIDNLRLNNIIADADVSFHNFKLINLADPINPQDGVNLRSMSAYVGINGTKELTGFVLGGPPVAGVMATTRGPTCLLANIPAGGDVSLGDFKIITLADPIADQDAVNLRTLNTSISNIPTTIQLTGDVTGSGNTGTPMITTLQLHLDQIKLAQDTVNLNNQKISNLKSDQVEQQDALNAKFLWDLMHNQVEAVWL